MLKIVSKLASQDLSWTTEKPWEKLRKGIFKTSLRCQSTKKKQEVQIEWMSPGYQ